jgi:hypothetical protein
MSDTSKSLVNKTASALYESVSNLWSHDNSHSSILSNKEVLRVGSVLNSIFQNNSSGIEIPRLVVVGSQSSGKSSLLNGILSIDLLPTGKNMVTRTPLHLELIPHLTENVAIFGNYRNGTWIKEKQFVITLPIPTEEQKKMVRDEIQYQTSKRAGNEMNISKEPIYLRILAKNIPNLTLIDLPGLTMVACTDRGQPKNIKHQIRDMVGSYISSPKSIILAVMPARTDLEADIALDLIKEYDPDGDRTIGVLTKVDLMNENTDISSYLENKVSKDLQMKYGYFAIRNRTTKESDEITLQEGYVKEREFFRHHIIYGKMTTNVLGIPNMTNKISEILIHNIKESLPTLLNKIENKIVEISKVLIDLGTSIPDSDEGKASHIHLLVSEFSRNVIKTVNDRGVILNTGRNIKKKFIGFRQELVYLNPFNETNYNKEYIEESIENCEGNHMTFPSPPIEVLEQCLQDQKYKPIQLLIEPSLKCSHQISQELTTLVDQLLSHTKLARFPNLIKKIRSELITKILSEYAKITNLKIKESVYIEESYIWTDDYEFRNKLESLVELKSVGHENIRILLESYYSIISQIISQSVPKIIMHFLVNNLEKELSGTFYEKVVSETTLDELLQEEDEIAKKRYYFKGEKIKLETAKKTINHIL